MSTTVGGSGTLLDLRAARAALQRASGKEKLELLLGAPDPRALVQSLPEQELYLSILDIGLDDAAPLVALATPRQFVHFLDAGCWPRRDAPPDPRKLLRWIGLAREGGGPSDPALDRFRELLGAIDAELFSLLLRLELVVHELDEDEPAPQIGSGDTWTSPDRRYLVEIREGGSGYPALKQLLDDLAAQDPFLVSRTLEAIRWDVPTELEETARRWRQGRLRDLGIPDFEEALGFVARPPRTRTAAPAPGRPLPATVPVTALAAPPRGQAPLLDRAMARLSGDDLAFAEEAVAYAANAALVAWPVQLDDAPEVRRVLTDAHALLSLGLELAGGGDEAEAARALASRPVREIFQAAMAELYRLQARGRAAAAALRLPQAQSATLAEPPHALLLDALAGAPPAVAGLLAPRPLHGRPTRGAEEAPEAVARAPGSCAEVALADALIDELEGLAALLAALGLDPRTLGPAAEEAGIAPSALRASDVLRARALADLAGRPFTLRGLEEAAAGPAPEGLDRALDALLDEGTRLIAPPELAPAARRIAMQLRVRMAAAADGPGAKT